MEDKTHNLSISKSTGYLDKMSKNGDHKSLNTFNGRFCGYSGCDNRHDSVSSTNAFESNGSDVSTEDNKLDSGIEKSLSESIFDLHQSIAKLRDLLQERDEALQRLQEKVRKIKNLRMMKNAKNDAEIKFIRAPPPPPPPGGGPPPAPASPPASPPPPLLLQKHVLQLVPSVGPITTV